VAVALVAFVTSLTLGAVAPLTVGATSARSESVWVASIGSNGANGKVTLRAFDTGAGSLGLALRRLSPSTGYAIAVHRGTCASLGTRILSAGTFRTGVNGTLSTSKAVTAAQIAAVRLAASGTQRISVRVGSGIAARCALLAKATSVVPQIWFAPLPPMPIREGRPYIGSSDFAALFAKDAPWQRVAGRTHVFKLYGEWLGGTASDADLRRVVSALKARQIAIAIEVGPLIATDCGNGVEGFAGGVPEALRLVRRVVAAGGAVRYLAMDEPYFFGSLYTGPNACRWSAAKVATEVARFVRGVKAAFPSIIVGDIEPLAGPATADSYQAWMAAARSAIGAPLPFFHLDLDWGRSDWAASSLALQAYARGHGVRFGMIYNSALAASDAEWLAAAQARILTHELDGTGPPDDAIFQSWTDHPDRVLPEAGPNTFTHLIADYTRARTDLALDPVSTTNTATAILAGVVRTRGGQRVPAARVDMSATPRDGVFQVFDFRGHVPAGATRAVIGVRVNQEGAGPGPADLTFYAFGYSEASGANLVPHPQFESGLSGWGPWGDASLTAAPSDRASGLMLRAVASSSETLGFNSDTFGVTPGAEYRFWFSGRVPEASIGSAYVAVIFVSDVSEVRRDVHPLAPAAISLGDLTTDRTGWFSFTSPTLEVGRYRLRATYPGDATRWPAWADADVAIP